MTLKEIAIMLQNHIENENERHNIFDEKLDGITSRLDYTNGNVKDLLIWRAYILGGMAVITAMVFPMIWYILNK